MNSSKLRRVFVAFMAVAVMMAFTVAGAFAADSPSKGDEYETKTVVKSAGEYKTAKDGSAAMVKVQKSKQKKAKTATVCNTVKVNGKTYNVNKVAAKAFKGCKKLKKLNIQWKTMKGKKFSAKAFKGLKKSQIKKIKVKVNKKMSKKQFQKLKKALVKAGIKKGNIKKTLKVK